MRTRSRRPGRAAAIGSVRGTSRGRGATGEQLCSLGLESPIVRAASRLALRATARCAAAALTRPARWALGPSDGQHGVPASVFVGPAVAIPEHGIKGSDHFAHDRDDRDLRLFADPNEATVEGTQSRVEPDRGQGRHVECVADADTTAVDVAPPAEPAAIEVVWRQADQRGDLLAADLAEFGHQGRQGIGERGADARHRAQKAEASGKVWLGCDQLGQTLVEHGDVGLYPGEAPLSDALQQGVFEMAGLALHRNMLVAELAAHRDGLSEPFEGRIALNHSGRHDRNIVGDQARIDAVVFRQSAGSASKLPQFVRVDPPHREAGCQQDADDATLVAATRFQADRGDRTLRQSSDQLSPAGRVVGDTKTAPSGSDCYVQTIDRNIDPDIVRFAHLRTPSLLMRARALATVRVWKIWLERQAHPRSDSQDAHGLPVMAGPVRDRATVIPENARFQTYKTRRFQTLRASCHSPSIGMWKQSQ